MRSKLAFKNSFFSIISLVLSTLFSFIIRKFLIKYLGIEVLGVNSVIAETINTLALSELGIQTAIIFRLYKPIAEGDIKHEGEIFTLFKQAYQIIGSFIIIAGLCVLPFVKYIVNTSVDMSLVWAVYIIQLLLVGLNYFVSYYRVLFLVHQQQYYCTEIDMLFQTITSVLQLVVLIMFKNYVIFLMIGFVNLIVSNVMIKNKCKKEFSFILGKYNATKEDRKNLFGDLKEIVFGNFAGYVYSSTDSLIISAFCGSIVVGYISNYKTITTAMRTCVNVVNNSVAPSWGNYLHQNKDVSQLKEMYYMFIFLQFVICSVTLIPVLCLADDFITLWLGKEFIIERMILVLIVADIFITNMHEPNAIVMRGLGLFREDKWISIVATIVNLFTSIIFVYLFGVKGVLVGTLLALFIFWFLRSRVVNKNCFIASKKEFAYYWYINIIYAVLFCGQYLLIQNIIKKVIIKNQVVQFIMRGLLVESIIIVIILLIFGRSGQMKVAIEKVIKPFLNRRKTKNEK